jgi:hypothetical protein
MDLDLVDTKIVGNTISISTNGQGADISAGFGPNFTTTEARIFGGQFLDNGTAFSCKIPALEGAARA